MITVSYIYQLEQENKLQKEQLLEYRKAFDSQKITNEYLEDEWFKTKRENKQLKEELNEILNDPDFGHMKNCGICGELVSKAIDEISAINVKGSRLTWVCNDCDNLKQKLEKIKELKKGADNIINQRDSDGSLAQELAYDFVVTFKNTLDSQESKRVHSGIDNLRTNDCKGKESGKCL